MLSNEDKDVEGDADHKVGRLQFNLRNMNWFFSGTQSDDIYVCTYI